MAWYKFVKYFLRREKKKKTIYVLVRTLNARGAGRHLSNKVTFLSKPLVNSVGAISCIRFCISCAPRITLSLVLASHKAFLAIIVTCSSSETHTLGSYVSFAWENNARIWKTSVLRPSFCLNRCSLYYQNGKFHPHKEQRACPHSQTVDAWLDSTSFRDSLPERIFYNSA
jgi:hypothetical protein